MRFHVRLDFLKAPKRACKYILQFEDDLYYREPWVALYGNKLLWTAWPGIRIAEEWRVSATLIFATWPRITARVGSPEAELLDWNVLDIPSLVYVAEGNKLQVPSLQQGGKVELYGRSGRKYLPRWSCDSIIDL